jgi:tetratricopeptide (TPR) repeat protein
MFNQPNKNLRVHHKILLLLSLIVVAPGSVRTTAFAFQSSPTAEEKKLQVASMQYDMIFLLIQNKNFDQVEAEWRKVLDQKLGAKYEKQIADSLLDILYKLSEAKQFLLAQKILDESLAAVSFSNKSKADILRFKALLYKDSGDLDSAIKTMQQALELATEK